MLMSRLIALFVLCIGLAGAVWAVPPPPPQVKRLEENVTQMAVQVSGTAASLKALEAKVGELQETVTRLDIQRQSEARNVDLSLDNAAKSVDYANMIVAGLGALVAILAILAAVFTAVFQWWSSRDRRKAIKEAADEVTAKLTAPEILKTVFSSQEFQDAYKKATEQRENAIKEENAAAASVAGSVVTEQSVENASGK